MLIRVLLAQNLGGVFFISLAKFSRVNFSHQPFISFLTHRIRERSVAALAVIVSRVTEISRNKDGSEKSLRPGLAETSRQRVTRSPTILSRAT